MSHSDRDAANYIGLTTDVRIELSHLLFVDLRETRVAVPSRVYKVLAKDSLIDLILLQLSHGLNLALI